MVWHVGSMVKLRPSAPKANVPDTLDKGKLLLNPYYSNGYTDISFGASICFSSSFLFLSLHSPITIPAPVLLH